MDVKKGSFDKVIEIFKKNMRRKTGILLNKGVIIWHPRYQPVQSNV